MLRGPRGETISRDEFEATRSSVVGVTVCLPDNGRDAIGSGPWTLVISEDDARL
jgi:hypothetical protein